MDDDATSGADPAPRRPMRATDDERHRVAEELSAALARGQIDLAEFDERTNKAWSARTRDELVEPLDDLIPDPWAVLGRSAGTAVAPFSASEPPAGASDARPPAHAGPRDLAAVARAHVTGEKGGSRFSAAVMFGADQSGDWVCPPQHYSVAVMGGVEVDLRRARFESAHTEIVAVAIMGGIEVIVPEDIKLTVQGTGLMGGFGTSTSRDVVMAGHDLPADAPTVRVTGIAVMGGVDVRRAPRRRGRDHELD